MSYFEHDKRIGTRGEASLDKYWRSLGYEVEVVPFEVQHLGIDRIIINPGVSRQSVEYKTDTRATDTGNIYLQFRECITSEDKSGRPAWVYTSVAQFAHIYLPREGAIIVVERVALSDQINAWQSKCPIHLERCDGFLYEGKRSSWENLGVLVPRGEVEEIARSVIRTAPKWET